MCQVLLKLLHEVTRHIASRIRNVNGQRDGQPEYIKYLLPI